MQINWNVNGAPLFFLGHHTENPESNAYQSQTGNGLVSPIIKTAIWSLLISESHFWYWIILWNYLWIILISNVFQDAVVIMLFNLTWVDEKSTLCKDLQFCPRACKDVSVMLEHPPMLTICKRRQLRARAMIPLSVKLLHLLKEASCR